MFPKSTLFIWNSTLPISRTAYGGFLVPEVEHLKNTLRLEILEANKFAYDLLKEYSFDMLDIHFYLRHHIHRRVKDGVHWDMTAHRRITNLLLTHISEAWQVRFFSHFSLSPFCSLSHKTLMSLVVCLASFV